jgi:hypothetical protein
MSLNSFAFKYGIGKINKTAGLLAVIVWYYLGVATSPPISLALWMGCKLCLAVDTFE